MKKLALLLLMQFGLYAQTANLINPFWGSAAPATNGLLTGLLGYWECETANASELDSSGSLTLTNSSAVGTSSGGVIGNRWVNFGSLNYYNATGAGFSPTTNSFTFSVWVKLDAVNADGGIAGKWTSAGDLRSYAFVFSDGSPDVFRFYVCSDGTAITVSSVAAEPTSAIAVDTFYFICGRYDEATDELSLVVGTYAGSLGSTATTTHADGFFDNAAVSFKMGGTVAGLLDNVQSADNLGLWNRKLSDTQVQQLFNGGYGLPFASFD